MTTPPNSPVPAVSQPARQALYEIAARCGLVVNEKNPDAVRGSEIIQRAIDAETASLLARATSAEAEVERLKAAAAKEYTAMDQLIDERDKAEETLSQAYYLITGNSPEWSNIFGHIEALEDIADDAQSVLSQSLKTTEAERDTARAHAVKLREALAEKMWAEEAANSDNPPANSFRCQEAADSKANSALALTADSLGSLAVVSKEELEQLRKDRELLNRLESEMRKAIGAQTFETGVACDVHLGASIRLAITDAMNKGAT